MGNISLWLTTTSKLRAGFAEGVHQVGHRQRGDVPLAGVLQLGNPQGASLGGIGLEVVNVADNQLVGWQFAAGGVINHVLADARWPG